MNNTTHLIIILDASGSMSPLESDVIGGYASLIAAQKKEEGECLVTTITFNSSTKTVIESTPIEKVEPLKEGDYVTGGCTALLDAIGSMIEKERQIQKKTGAPDHTIFSIMTDGYENVSRKYTYPLVKEMIESQKKDGWDFLFQAANIDVAAESQKLGLDQDLCYQFEASHKGMRQFCLQANSSIMALRKAPSKKRKE